MHSFEAEDSPAKSRDNKILASFHRVITDITGDTNVLTCYLIESERGVRPRRFNPFKFLAVTTTRR